MGLARPSLLLTCLAARPNPSEALHSLEKEIDTNVGVTKGISTMFTVSRDGQEHAMGEGLERPRKEKFSHFSADKLACEASRPI